MKNLNYTKEQRGLIGKSAGKLRAFRAAAICFLLTLTFSCSKPEWPPVCPNGDCEAMFNVPYPMDKNGYYQVKLNFNQEYSPRFSIEVAADPTHPYYWYNETPVVEARFSSSSVIHLQHEKVPVVQPARIYLSGDPSKKLYGKRIIGPILNEMIGDTLKVDVEVFWDAGGNYKIKNYGLNFIIFS